MCGRCEEGSERGTAPSPHRRGPRALQPLPRAPPSILGHNRHNHLHCLCLDPLSRLPCPPHCLNLTPVTPCGGGRRQAPKDWSCCALHWAWGRAWWLSLGSSPSLSLFSELPVSWHLLREQIRRPRREHLASLRRSVEPPRLRGARGRCPSIVEALPLQ